jgi:hypothetical protein
VERVSGHLHVDPGVGREARRDGGPALERGVAAELRQERVERRVGGLGPFRRQDGLHELGPADGAPAVGAQVREQQAALPPRQRRLDAPSFDPGNETAAEVDPRLRQAFANVLATSLHDNAACPRRRRGSMGKVINCECGAIVRADDDDELVAKVERHVGEVHPGLVGKLSREDILGMAEEA